MLGEKQKIYIHNGLRNKCEYNSVSTTHEDVKDFKIIIF